MDPLSFSFRKCSHEKAKDSTKEDNSETLRQIMELDLKHGVNHEDGEDEGEEEEGNGQRG